MKRIIALFCVLAMLFGVCGCTQTTVETSVLSFMEGEGVVTESGDGSDKVGKDSNTNSDKGTANNGDKNTVSSSDKGGNDVINTGSNSIIDNPLNVDLKGATVTIYDAGGLFTADASVSKTQQTKAGILKRIQKELNCKFNVKTVDGDKLRTLAATSASAGKAIGGIITHNLYFSGSYISQNLVANLTRVSSLDLSKDYMNRANVLNATQFGKGKYAVALGAQERTFCVFYNKRILKEMGYSDNYLYDLVDKGKWTYSEYRKLAKKAMKELDGKSGMSVNDQWGQAIQDPGSGMAPNIVVSMGTSMIKLVNGKLKLNMTDSKIMKAIDLSCDVITKDATHYEARGEEAVKFFATGNSLFLYAYGIKASSLTKMKDEFGLLPAPKVDGAKDYSTAVDGNVNVAMIPAGLSAKDQYNAGAVLQAYMYLYKEIEETEKKEYINRYFCDEKSGENWLLAASQAKAQPVQCYSRISEAILTGTDRVFWNAIEKGSSASKEIESSKTAAQKALDDLNTKIKDK